MSRSITILLAMLFGLSVRSSAGKLVFANAQLTDSASGQVVMTLKADGSFQVGEGTFKFGRDGKIRDSEGKVLLTVAGNGTLRNAQGKMLATLKGDRELSIDGSLSIRIGGDGVLRGTQAGFAILISPAHSPAGRAVLCMVFLYLTY